MTLRRGFLLYFLRRLRGFFSRWWMWCFPGELCGHTTFDLRFFVVKTWWNVWLAWWKHGVSLADISGRKVCQNMGLLLSF